MIEQGLDSDWISLSLSQSVLSHQTLHLHTSLITCTHFHLCLLPLACDFSELNITSYPVRRTYHWINYRKHSLSLLHASLDLIFFFFFLSFKWKQTGVNAHSWWLVKHAGEICGFLKKVMMFQQPLSEVSVPVTTRDKHLGKLGDKNKIHIASV